jgi:hypothetical protein
MDVPNLYCDGVQVALGPFDVVLQLTQRPADVGTTGKPAVVGIVRTSLEHAKMMAVMLRKVIKQHEERIGGKIPIPLPVWQQLGLSEPEDW